MTPATRRGLALLAVGVAMLAATLALDTARYPAWAPASGRADVAVVLGAAVRGDRPSPVYAARLHYAARLFREGRVGRVVLTGGTRDPAVATEPGVRRAYLRRAGVPDAALAAEDRSTTTWQTLACARPLVADGERVWVVSDPLDLRRAVTMARHLGLDAAPAATPTTRYRSWRTRAPLLAREVWFRAAYGLARATGTRGACPLAVGEGAPAARPAASGSAEVATASGPRSGPRGLRSR